MKNNKKEELKWINIKREALGMKKIKEQ
jgi:hypothetical protein